MTPAMRELEAAFDRHTAPDGSIPAGKVSDLARDISHLLSEAIDKARQDGYEEGHLGEDL
jgi:hypothetical protein